MSFRLSKSKNKKYDVYYDGKWISFGDSRYEHYKTSNIIPNELHIYKEHNDKNRRQLYRNRASKIKNKYGELTFNNPRYPNFWAFHLLW